MARKVLQGEFKDGDTVTVDANEEGIVFRTEAVRARV